MDETQAIRSAREGVLPDLVATVYAQSPVPLRSKVLACLLGALGPLSMAALSQGSFARFLFRNPSDAAFVTAEDAMSIPAAHVMTLVRYVSEANPGRLVSLVELLQHENPAMVGTLTGAALVLLIDTWLRRSEAPPR